MIARKLSSFVVKSSGNVDRQRPEGIGTLRRRPAAKKDASVTFQYYYNISALLNTGESLTKLQNSHGGTQSPLLVFTHYSVVPRISTAWKEMSYLVPLGRPVCWAFDTPCRFFKSVIIMEATKALDLLL
ncbi:hypothetical protein L798_04021 [Zootermopsis nevadensis]|uniref:Uncharacterized protein n=1 Tax=Zootermopsis nevadensis TaxID=136037 RepID=A0A067QGC5_ZOONE|nr:hypothetical protein L798_04021 [Zootermopsis nevadensis]